MSGGKESNTASTRTVLLSLPPPPGCARRQVERYYFANSINPQQSGGQCVARVFNKLSTLPGEMGDSGPEDEGGLAFRGGLAWWYGPVSC